MQKGKPFVDVILLPSKLRYQVPLGTSLLDFLVQHGCQPSTPCGGNGTCGKCLISQATGQAFIDQYDQQDQSNDLNNEFDHWQNLFSFEQVLACQLTLQESALIWCPLKNKGIAATQTMTSHETFAYYDDRPILHFNVVQNKSCEAVSLLGETITLQPLSFSDATPSIEYAVAVDIGTTTLAASLLNLRTNHTLNTVAARNPQCRFGDDVISRIQNAAESPAQFRELNRSIVNAVNELVDELLQKNNLIREQIAVISIAGNTVMQQFFCNIDTEPLTRVPFQPSQLDYPITYASQLGVMLNPDARVILFPVIGGFVGGDITAGIVATNMRHCNNPVLLIDIGTNGEMVLWHKNNHQQNKTTECFDGQFLVAATAAGPAFEGARIEHGMIASHGAIERIQITDTLHFHVIGNQQPLGICGSGLIDLVAELIRIGAITERGKLLAGDQLPEQVPKTLHPRFVTEGHQTSFEIASANESATHKPIRLTQHDIRQVQLAAGAVRTGITLLLREAKLNEQALETIYLAGGFGSYIRRENAQQIGLLPPDIPTKRIIFCGNTSLAGCKAILQSETSYHEMHAVTQRAKHIDLAHYPDFSTIFAESMLFPTPRH